MKRPILFILSLFLLASPLWALEAGFDIAAGMRESSIESAPLFVSAEVNIEDFSLYVQSDMGEIYDLVAAYEINHNSVTHVFDTAMQIVPDEGGFNLFSYIFTQHFKWGVFGLSYGIGLQFGLAWSPYSHLITPSLAPVGNARLSLGGKVFEAGVFYSSWLKEERSWKPCLSVGLDARLSFSKNVALYGMCYAEFAEVFTDPSLLVSSYGFKVGLKVGGNL